MVPLLLAGGVLAVLILVGALTLRTLVGGSAGGGATATLAGSAVAALPSAIVDPTAIAKPVASAAPSAVASAQPGASAPPSAVASAPPSASVAPSAAPSALPVVATPAGATTREVVLFSSHRNGVHDSQIYTMSIDGGGQRILVNAKGHSWGPRVSPDGKFIIFSTVIGSHSNHTATGGGQQGTGHHEVFRARTDGSEIVQLTTSAENIWNNAWAWSPDSKTIVFASDRDGNWELYRMAADGSEVTRLTNHPAQDGWPTLTPDGKSIIFASDREGSTSQLYMMDADGKNVRRLVRSEAYDTLPSISPDGKAVVYSSQSGSLGEIYLLDLATTATTRLTSTVALNTDPSFSPDGSKIVFTSDRDGNTNIYMMDSDGKNQRRLTDDPGEDVTPFWAVVNVAATTPTVAPRATLPYPGALVADLPRRREA
jgi:Tol biopolymer transport system component